MPDAARLLATLAVLTLAACSDPAPPASDVAPPTQPARPVADTETVTARYACPSAGEVDIIRDGRFARLRLVDGRIVHLGTIQDSRPPVWSDVGLRFTADGDFIELAQDSGRTIACTPLPDPEAELPVSNP